MSTRKALFLGGLVVFLAFVLLIAIVAIFVPSDDEALTTEGPTTTSTVASISQSTPTPIPTATRAIPPTTTLRPPVLRMASWQDVYTSLDDLNIGLLPLNRHTELSASMMSPNGDIQITIYGFERQVEAIDLQFRLSAPTEDVFRAVKTLIQTLIPQQQDQTMTWFLDAIDYLGEPGTERTGTTIGGVYLTAAFLPSLRSMFFSIDSEQLR